MELDGLRARIKAMADQQELEKAEAWVPESMGQMAAKVNSNAPEMTSKMESIASFLGDDRVDADDDMDEGDRYMDPYAELSGLQALIEEFKNVEWPTFGKVIRSLGLVYGSITVLALLILAWDKLLVSVLGQVFTYGKNNI